MYQLTEEPVNQFVAAAENLANAFTKSPYWVLIKDEPVIVEAVAAYQRMRNEILNGKTP
jgi:hypothetical protein